MKGHPQKDGERHASGPVSVLRASMKDRPLRDSNLHGHIVSRVLIVASIKGRLQREGDFDGDDPFCALYVPTVQPR